MYSLIYLNRNIIFYNDIFIEIGKVNNESLGCKGCIFDDKINCPSFFRALYDGMKSIPGIRIRQCPIDSIRNSLVSEVPLNSNGGIDKVHREIILGIVKEELGMIRYYDKSLFMLSLLTKTGTLSVFLVTNI